MTKISHFNRCSVPSRHYRKELSAKMVMNSFDDVVEHGHIVKKSVMKTVDPKENFSGIHVSDFFLDNVISVGAIDSLKEGQVISSRLAAADNFALQSDKIQAAIDSSVSEVQPS